MSYHTTGHASRRSRSRLTVTQTLGVKEYQGRQYKLLRVETKEGLEYLCLRLYNGNGHFIKQFLFEPGLVPWLQSALALAQGGERGIS
jgi:hypothetical protein